MKFTKYKTHNRINRLDLKVGMVVRFFYNEEKHFAIVIKIGNWNDNYDSNSIDKYGDKNDIWIAIVRLNAIEHIGIEHSNYFKPASDGGRCGFINNDNMNPIRLIGRVDKRELETILIASKMGV